LKKVYFKDSLPLGKELEEIYRQDPNNHDDAYESVVLYMLHKGGLLEDGMPEIQFGLIFDAFIEAMNVTAEVIDKQKRVAKG
jgi:hypothetical protein